MSSCWKRRCNINLQIICGLIYIIFRNTLKKKERDRQNKKKKKKKKNTQKKKKNTHKKKKKRSLLGSNSKPWDQESRALPTQLAGRTISVASNKYKVWKSVFHTAGFTCCRKRPTLHFQMAEMYFHCVELQLSLSLSLYPMPSLSHCMSLTLSLCLPLSLFPFISTASLSLFNLKELNGIKYAVRSSIDTDCFAGTLWTKPVLSRP